MRGLLPNEMYTFEHMPEFYLYHSLVLTMILWRLRENIEEMETKIQIELEEEMNTHKFVSSEIMSGDSKGWSRNKNGFCFSGQNLK